MPTSRQMRRKGAKKGRRGGKSNNGAKFAALGLGVVAVLGAGGYVLNEVNGIEKPGSDGCYIRADQHRTAVLIDSSMTAQMSDFQMRDLGRALEDTFASAPPNGRITVHTTDVDSGGSISRPVIDLCRPPATPQEQASINAPSKPAPFLERKFNEAAHGYVAKIAQVLADARDVNKNAVDSPILQQVRGVSRHDAFKGRNRTLVVITDGVENSELARFCVRQGDMPTHATFAKRPDYEHVIRPDPLDGAHVKLLLVEFGKLPSSHMPFCTNDELRRWWPDYFRANGAADVELTRLRYWGAS